MKTVSPLAFILLLAMQPTNRVLWLLMLFAAGICTYIFTIAEKEKSPARAGTPHKRNM